MTELTDGVKTLVKSFDYVAERAENSTGVFKDQIRDFTNSAVIIKKEVSDLLNEISPRIKEIRESSEALGAISESNSAKLARANEMLLEYGNKTGETIAHVSDVLSGQSDRLEQVSSKAVKSCEEVFAHLDDGISRIDGTLRGQSKFILDHIESLGKQNDALSKSFSRQGEFLAAEVDKVMARANVIEESISNQVRELEGVSDHILDSLNNVSSGIDEKLPRLNSNPKPPSAVSTKLLPHWIMKPPNSAR